MQVNPDAAKNRVAVTLRSEDRTELSILGDSERSINEGQNAEIMIASSKAIDIGEDLVINYKDEGIRAVRNTDYSFNVATITIKQGESRGALVLESKFDSVEEATEGVKLQIDTIQNSALQNNLYNNYISIADASVATITIRDRNTLRLVTNSVTEQVGIVELTLELDRVVADSTTEVAYAVTTGTAGARDFDATNGAVTIKGGDRKATFEIAIKDDKIVEKTETFEVRLTNLRSTDAIGNAITQSPVTIALERNEVEIRDNDEAQISISPSSLEIAEGDSTSLTIESSKKIAEDVTIDIAVSGTAKAREDYTALASQVILTKDTTSVTINLATLSDDAIEGNETVLVTLTKIVNTGYEANALIIDQAKKETIATIKDEDGLVTLRIESGTGTSEANIAEGNSGTKALLFVVKSDKPISEAVTINFAAVTKEGSARDSLQTAPDFSQSTINGSISGGDTKELEVIIYGDTRVERDETFDIALEIISSTAGIEATIDRAKNNLAVTITDEDKAIFRFVKDETTGIEGGKITLEVMTDSVIEDVEIELTSNAAVNSRAGIYNQAVAKDYDNRTGTLKFSDATRTGQIEYMIVDDNIVELAESFLVMLSAVGNEKVETRVAIATVNIEVDRKDTTRLSINSRSEAEGSSGSTGIILTVELTNPISAPISFNYRTEGGTARGENSLSAGTPVNPVDYLIKSGTETISDTDRTTITIQINPDRTVETTENFNVVLSALNLGRYYDATQVSFAAGGDSAVATITNDDTAVLNLIAGQVTEPASAGDNNNDLTFTIAIANGVVADEPITVNFETIGGGTATAIADYIAVNERPVTIQAGNSNATQIVEIKGDDKVEGPETLSARIRTIANSDISSSVSFTGGGTNVETQASIGDDDGIDFRIDVSSSDIAEGTGTTTDVKVTIVIVNASEYVSGANINVGYEATLDRDAKGSSFVGRASEEDFEATDDSFTFSPGSTSDSFTFSIVRDDLVEREETLKLIFNIDGLGQFSNGAARNIRTITIQNDDTATLSIANANQAENAGPMQFAIASDLELAEDVTIDIKVSTANSSATTSDNDYTALQNADYTLTRGGNTHFSVQITPDNKVEADETFDVSISASSLQIQNSAHIISTDKAIGTIQNDDRTNLSIISNADTTEGNAITFTVSSDYPIDRDITVGYTTAGLGPNEATEGENADYTTDNSITLAAGNTTTDIVVNTRIDGIVERAETFEVNLTNNISGLSGSPQQSAIDSKAIIVNTTTRIGTINNADIATLIISSANATEGLPIRFTVSSNIPIAEDVTVDYMTTVGGTAIAGTDYIRPYTTPVGSVTLPADQLSTSIGVTTVPDNIVERNETFRISLTSVGRNGINDSDITFGDTTTAIGTIINDDIATISIADATANEGSNITFTVASDKAIFKNITVDYMTRNGSAVSPGDYTTTDSSVPLNAGKTTASIVVNTVTDGIVGADETFDIIISVDRKGIANKAIILSNNTATGTIINDDKATLSITRDASTTEGDGAKITFTVKSDKPIDKPINVNYTTTEGTAKAGTDYGTPTPNVITLPASTVAQTGSIEVPIINDSIVEVNENFTIALSPYSGIYSDDITASTDSKTGAIIDDDTATLSITSNADATEGEMITFIVESDKAIDRDVTVRYMIEGTGDYPAIAGVGGDIPATGSVTLSGSQTKTFRIEATEDTTVEANETFNITLSGIVGDTGGIELSKTKATAKGTINNDDTANFTLTAPDATNEGNSGESKDIAFTISSISNIADNVTFLANLEIAGGMAANTAILGVGEDFTAAESPKMVTLNSGNNFRDTLSISIIGDNLVEANETINARVVNNLITSIPAGAKYSLTGSPETTRILNDDTAMISVTAMPTSLEEPKLLEMEFVNFRITSTNPIANNVIFNFTLGGTATAGVDYTSPMNTTATLVRNTMGVDIPITILSDDLLERDETLDIMLSGSLPASVDFVTASASVTIMNNPADKVNVSIAPIAAAITEGEDATFTVTITPQALTFDYPFSYEIIGVGGASINASDFINGTTGTITVMSGDTTAELIIRTVDDRDIELDETFDISITSNNEVEFRGDPAQVTILNNDLGEISGISATAVKEGIELSWTNPASNIFAGVTIAHRIGDDAPADCSGGRQLGNITRDIVTGLTNRNNYSFRICARDTNRQHSAGIEEEEVAYNIVDSNSNGLIDIFDATGLSNMRHNLTGTSYKTSSGGSTNSIGCPVSGCNGYELINNIDLNSITNWMPIGSNGSEFTATFDGKGYTISSLFISGSDHVGFFGVIDDASIGNLKLANVVIIGSSNVGALVGSATGTTTLSNIELIGDESQSSSNPEINGTGSNVGGLVGLFSDGTISDASSSLTVKGGASDSAANTGGLVGNFGSGTITNSHSSGYVSASDGADTVGGLVGNQGGGNINQSWASGNVYSMGADSDSYGGLVGVQNTETSISQSWASGNVSSIGTDNDDYGGLVGSAEGNIRQSWAGGNVSSIGTESNNYGGLVGLLSAGNIRQNWASGNVSSMGDSSDFYGGLVGAVGSLVTISGRNYQLDASAGTGINLANDDGMGESFVLDSTTALADLSGATGDRYEAFSDWHAGFDIDNTTDGDNNSTGIDLETRFCDTNGNGIIDDGTVTGNPDEQVDSNSVWVMSPNDVAAPTTNEAGRNQNYYAIPAIRCIGTSAERRANIDLQRRQFPNP